jgi:hypothetical protein
MSLLTKAPELEVTRVSVDLDGDSVLLTGSVPRTARVPRSNAPSRKAP